MALLFNFFFSFIISTIIPSKENLNKRIQILTTERLLGWRLSENPSPLFLSTLQIRDTHYSSIYTFPLLTFGKEIHRFSEAYSTRFSFAVLFYSEKTVVLASEGGMDL